MSYPKNQNSDTVSIHQKKNKKKETPRHRRKKTKQSTIEVLTRKIHQQKEEINKYVERVRGFESLHEKLKKLHKKETEELKNHVERRVNALEHSNEIRNQIVFDKRKLQIENKNLQKEINELRSEKLELELTNTRLENQIKKLKRSARKLSQGKPTKLIFEDETIQFIGSRKRNLVTRKNKIKKKSQRYDQTKTISIISPPMSKLQNSEFKKRLKNPLRDKNRRNKPVKKIKVCQKKRRISNELPTPLEMSKDKLLARRQTINFSKIAKKNTKKNTNKNANKNHWFKRFKNKKKTNKTLRFEQKNQENILPNKDFI
ncbi:protein spindly [Anaeramoeba flamelloides]|uniref:Protein spindly n=1 Tax=Anaeramoeba flamelloides TaxID=1746091 RepID=A0AAV7ZWK1_9EUKA|nr:protein spindly [Anaeramoeba flamelloides]